MICCSLKINFFYYFFLNTETVKNFIFSIRIVIIQKWHFIIDSTILLKMFINSYLLMHFIKILKILIYLDKNFDFIQGNSIHFDLEFKHLILFKYHLSMLLKCQHLRLCNFLKIFFYIYLH